MAEQGFHARSAERQGSFSSTVLPEETDQTEKKRGGIDLHKQVGGRLPSELKVTRPCSASAPRTDPCRSGEAKYRGQRGGRARLGPQGWAREGSRPDAESGLTRHPSFICSGFSRRSLHKCEHVWLSSTQLGTICT